MNSFLMHGDVVGLVTFDLVLGRVLTGAARMAFIGRIRGMYLNDGTADLAGLGVSADVIIDLEFVSHDLSPVW